MIDNKLKTQIANYAGVYRSMETPQKTSLEQAYIPKDTERKLTKTCAEAWDNYSNSEEGKTQLAAMTTMDLTEQQEALQKIADNPTIQAIIAEIESFDTPIKSFSIGLNFEAEFIIGITGTIGVAIGVNDSKGVASSEFLCLGVDEGIDEGVLAGVQFGFWASSPSDLGGYSWSTEVDLGLGAEISTAVSYTASGGFGGFTVEIGGGEEDGFMEVESYTFILGDQSGDGFLRAVYQTPKNNLLIITSLKCKHPSNDGLGDENEVYFIFKADNEGSNYYCPTYDYYSMKEGDTWNCGRSVWFDSYVTVAVYDDDGTSSNDEVGAFTIHLSDLTLNQSKTFNSNKDYSHGFDDIEYTINVKLVAQNVQS